MDTIQCQLTNSQTLLENTHTYIQHLKEDHEVIPIFL